MPKITELDPPPSPVDGSELVPLVQGGAMWKSPIGSLVDALAGPYVESAAQSAAFAEEFSGPAYETIAAGEAATTAGQFFRVSNGDTPRTYTRYQRTAGGSVVAVSLATTADLASSAPGKGLDLIGTATVAQLLASTAPARGMGSIWNAGGFRYQEAAPGATDHHLVTAGGVKLYILPGATGAYQFEAAAPNILFATARAWATALPSGSILNVSGNYTTDASMIFPNKIKVVGNGKFTHPSGVASFILVELRGAGSEWYLELDGNRSGLVSGTANTLFVSSADGVTIGAKIYDSPGSNVFFNLSPNGKITQHCEFTGAATSGLIASNGSSRLIVEDGARIKANDKDNIQITDGGTGNPSNYPRISGADVSEAGQAGGGFWCGIRIRYCRGFRISGVIGNNCSVGAGLIIQGQAANPATYPSQHGTVIGCTFEYNFDGVIVDDYCRDITLKGNQCNNNTQDGIDFNYVVNCKSIGDTTCKNGQKGFLFWGSQKCSAIGLTSNDNAQDAGNPAASVNDAGVNIQTNTNTVPNQIPYDCRVLSGQMTDNQGVKTQNHGIFIEHGTGHRIEENDVRGNKTSAISDATGTPSQNPKRRNRGYKTEANFSATIPAGQTSVVIGSGTTGLVGTGVTIQQLGFAALGDIGTGNRVWPSAIGTQGFTLNIATALGGNMTFNCWVRVYGDGAGM